MSKYATTAPTHLISTGEGGIISCFKNTDIEHPSIKLMTEEAQMDGESKFIIAELTYGHMPKTGIFASSPESRGISWCFSEITDPKQALRLYKNMRKNATAYYQTGISVTNLAKIIEQLKTQNKAEVLHFIDDFPEQVQATENIFYTVVGHKVQWKDPKPKPNRSCNIL